MANRRQLANKVARYDAGRPGAPRKGNGLLQGIVSCGRCGRHMTDVGESPADAWMGWSRARWEGDTLVVNVTNQIDQTWFDRAGNFHSEALTVVERYSPVSADVIQYDATMTDPKIFTRPWKISLPLYRHLEKNAQVLEFKCVPFAEELVYGHLRKK